MSNILYHPHFGQPKVDNPVSRGPKKHCVSFQSALRKREAAKRVPPAPPSLPAAQVDSSLISEWSAEVRDYLLRIETVSKLMASERRIAK